MEKYEHKYGADQIQVLEGLEAVRKRLLKTHLKEVQRLSLNGEIVERQSFLMINAKHDDNAEKDLLKRCLDLSNKFER